jgi:predicted XRE-type DNA-binding protein
MPATNWSRSAASTPYHAAVTDDPIAGMKRQLIDEILHIAERLNFFIAAALFEIDPSRLSDLRHGRGARFSVEWLIRLLGRLGRSVELNIVTVDRPERRWARILRERRAMAQSPEAVHTRTVGEQRDEP